MRFSPGNVSGQITNGFYWSRDPINATYAYALSFTADQLNPNNTSNEYTRAYSVRCVYDPAYTTVSPFVITFSSDSHTPALGPNEVLTVTSNQAWTLTSTPPWLRLTLNSDGSGADTSVSGVENQNVYLVLDQNPSFIYARAANILRDGILQVVVVQNAQE
jgi:hypothetical protein